MPSQIISSPLAEKVRAERKRDRRTTTVSEIDTIREFHNNAEAFAQPKYDEGRVSFEDVHGISVSAATESVLWNAKNNERSASGKMKVFVYILERRMAEKKKFSPSNEIIVLLVYQLVFETLFLFRF